MAQFKLSSLQAFYGKLSRKFEQPYHLSISHDLMKGWQREIILQTPHQAAQSPFEPGQQAALELSEAPMVGVSLLLGFFSRVANSA
jgi:hypothetical protein